MIILIIQFKCKIKQKTLLLYENSSNFLRSERLKKIRIILVVFFAYFFSCTDAHLTVYASRSQTYNAN